MLQSLIHKCRAINLYLGRFVSWGTFIMVLFMAATVALRYTVQSSAIWQQELIRYLHVAVFMGSAGYALLRDEHVRVDVFYSKLSDNKKRYIDLLGTLFFLLPFCIAGLYYSYEFIASSWRIWEPSAEPLGLPFVYILKSFIGVFFVSLILQSIVTIGEYYIARRS